MTMFARIGTTGDDVGWFVGGNDIVGACDIVGVSVGELTGEFVGFELIGDKVGLRVMRCSLSADDAATGEELIGDDDGAGAVGPPVTLIVVGLSVGQFPSGHGNSCISPYLENGSHGSRS